MVLPLRGYCPKYLRVSTYWDLAIEPGFWDSLYEFWGTFMGQATVVSLTSEFGTLRAKAKARARTVSGSAVPHFWPMGLASPESKGPEVNRDAGFVERLG